MLRGGLVLLLLFLVQLIFCHSCSFKDEVYRKQISYWNGLRYQGFIRDFLLAWGEAVYVGNGLSTDHGTELLAGSYVISCPGTI